MKSSLKTDKPGLSIAVIAIILVVSLYALANNLGEPKHTIFSSMGNESTTFAKQKINSIIIAKKVANPNDCLYSGCGNFY